MNPPRSDVRVVTLEMASGTLAAVTGSSVSPKTFAIRLTGTRAVLDYRADVAVWPAPEGIAALRAIRAALAPADRDEAWQPAPH